MKKVYRVKSLLKWALKSSLMCAKKGVRKSVLDHKRILEDCNDVQLMLCQQLIAHAKTSEERKRAEKLLRRVQLDRELIPISLARRGVLGI